MTETFRASDGSRIEAHDDNRRIDIKCTGSSGEQHFLSVKETQAAREFFQHERDEELGRWRWPENPDYVVYAPRDFTHYVRVLDERSAVLEVIHREHLEGRGSLMAQAARAYFEAHPERKPWHDAKPGEIWVLTIDGEEQVVSAVQQYEKDFNPISHPIYATFANGSEHITDARKIWPEDAS